MPFRKETKISSAAHSACEVTLAGAAVGCSASASMLVVSCNSSTWFVTVVVVVLVLPPSPPSRFVKNSTKFSSESSGTFPVRTALLIRFLGMLRWRVCRKEPL